MTSEQKLKQSLEDLKHALSFRNKALKDHFYYLGIAKAFEVALEYAWKSLQKEAVEAGFEVQSPRDAIKLAGQLKLISDVEQWLNFLRIRNVAVHDYLGVEPEDYLKAIERFLEEAQNLPDARKKPR